MLSAMLAVLGAAAGLGPFLAIWWDVGIAFGARIETAHVCLAVSASLAFLLLKSFLLAATPTLSHAAALRLLIRLRIEMVDRIVDLPWAVWPRKPE